MKLLHGDCLELLKDLEPKSVDLVFCDLPYGQTYCEWDNKIDLDDLWNNLKRVIKKTTPLFFTCSTKFGYELIKSNEKWFRYDLVWEKSTPVGFLNAKRMPMKKHEMIYVFYEKMPLYDISSHTPTFVEYDLSPRQTCGIYNKTYGKAEKHLYDPPLPTSVLQFRSERGKHNTQKPSTMMNWILKYYSKTGDVVLDPTMGSGSMAVACKEMDREFIGIEMDEEIFESACRRLHIE